jgi:hypothetical protein
MPLGQIQVPWPDTTYPGIPTRSQESSGRIINAYIEPLGPAAPGVVIYRRAPGLRNFATTTRTGFRGAIEVSGTLYMAFNNRLVSVTAGGGAATDIGAFTGTRKGFFARNQSSPTPQIVFADPDGNYASFVPPSTIGLNYDVDLPAPNSVCTVDNFFFFTIGDGRVFASDFNATNINALSFASAEAKPDGLTRGVAWAGQLWLFGPSTTEVWANAGTSPFPFARSVVIPRGIAGPYCVSGFEDNFSRDLIWVADDNTVVRAQGYNPVPISTPDLNGLIEDVTDKSTLELSCFMSRGHGFVILSSPTWSWVCDLDAGKWAERNSYLQARSRITGGVFAFGKWLVGDTLSGNIQEVTDQTHQEIGQPFRWRLESGAVENFPVGQRIGRADFEFVTGVGQATGTEPIQTDPTVEISWSDDGGNTYYAPIQRKLGKQAMTKQLVSLIACTGRSSWNARRWRLDVADPVYVGFMGSYQNVSPKVSDIG